MIYKTRLIDLEIYKNSSTKSKLKIKILEFIIKSANRN